MRKALIAAVLLTLVIAAGFGVVQQHITWWGISDLSVRLDPHTITVAHWTYEQIYNDDTGGHWDELVIDLTIAPMVTAHARLDVEVPDGS